MPVPAILINDTRIDLHHGCARVIGGLGRLLEGQGISIVGSLAAHRDWREDAALCEQIAASRLLVVNGEGTLHHDATQAHSLLSVAGFAAGCGVPSVLLNFTWERNGSELAAMLADFALLSARDARSAEAVRNRGYACDWVPDLSLYSPGAMPAQVRHGLGFTDSVLAPASLLLDAVRRREQGRAVSIHARLPGASGLLEFIRRGRPWSVGYTPSRQWRGMLARLAQWQVACGDAGDFLAGLAGLAGLVSGRYHACVLALLVETPFIALPSNTRKIENLLEDAGLDRERLVSPARLQGVLPERVAAWSPQELDSIRDYVAAGRADMEQLARNIRRLL